MSARLQGSRSAITSVRSVPHHDLGERSLERIRAFYTDPSEIGWLPHPLPDAGTFCTGLKLEHGKTCSPGRSVYLPHDCYVGFGELTLSRCLTFIGRSTRTGRRELATVTLGCDCPQYLAPLLKRHSQELLLKSVEDAQKAPASTTFHFVARFEDMLQTVLQEMVSSTASSGRSAFVSERPDVEANEFWSLVTVNAQATANFKDKQGYVRPDTFATAVTYKVLVAGETDRDSGETKRNVGSAT